MLRRLATSLLPRLRVTQPTEQEGVQRCFRAVADVEVDLQHRETLKKYVGVRDHLSPEPGTKSAFVGMLKDLLEAAKSLPGESDYRRALEATSQYRISVCEANDSEAAIEEVLDAHIEELMRECKEEMSLIPLMAQHKPWDVAADYQVPVFDYHSAEEVLNAPKK